MADQTKNDNESYTQDNAGTGAENFTENDVPANLNTTAPPQRTYTTTGRPLDSLQAVHPQ